MKKDFIVFWDEQDRKFDVFVENRDEFVGYLLEGCDVEQCAIDLANCSDDGLTELNKKTKMVDYVVFPTELEAYKSALEKANELKG